MGERRSRKKSRNKVVKNKEELPDYICSQCKINIVTHNDHCRGCCTCGETTYAPVEVEGKQLTITVDGRDIEVKGEMKLTEPAPHLFETDLSSPSCADCGAITNRSGSCYTCPNCGWNTGCG